MLDLLQNESFHFLLLINIVAAVGMNLVYVTGQLNVGQAGFMAVGAYAAALTDILLGWPLAASLLVGAAAAGLVAIPVALGANRLRGVYLIMGTLAAGEIIRVALGNIEAIGGDQGLSGMQPIGLGEAALTAIAVVAAAALLMASPLGLQMRAVFDDEDAAAAAGVQTARIKLFSVVVSAAVVGIAGGLLARWFLFIAPRNFGIDLSFRIALFSLIGGVHSLFGAVLGAVSITSLLEALKRIGDLPGLPSWTEWIAGWRMVIFGGLVMALMAWLPEGLVSRQLVLSLTRPFRGRWPRRRRETEIKPADRTERNQGAPAGTTTESLLVFFDVSHDFGGVRAVDQFSLSVKSGELLALIGANGAGKTTLTNVAAGRIPVQTGSIRFRDREIGGLGAARRTRLGIARTFQSGRVFSHLTVSEQIELGLLARSGRPGPGAAKLLEEIGLTAKSDQLPNRLTLSERQKLEIGRAAATVPEVLFLDEPFVGMNAAECDELVAIIRLICCRGTAVVLIDHNLDVVFDIAHRVAVMDHGGLLMDGLPGQVVTDDRVREAYIGRMRVQS